MKSKGSPSLSDSIAGLDVAPLALRKFSLVGAEAGEFMNGLSEIDSVILRSALGMIAKKWEMPDLLPEDGVSIDIINILKKHGGRDFLKEPFSDSMQTDVLVLCNIPAQASDHHDFIDTSRRYSSVENNWDDEVSKLNALSALIAMGKSFEASANHEDMDAWRNQIDASGAKVIVVSGQDSFKPSEIMSDLYIEVPSDLKEDAFANVWIKKEYLEAAYDHIIFNEKPLEALANSVVFDDDDLARIEAKKEAEAQKP